MIILSTMILALTVSLAASPAPPKSRLISIGTAALYPPKPDKPRCPSANKAIDFYRAAYRTSRNGMGLTDMPPRRWWGCTSARRRAAEWRDKAHVARKALVEWTRYQYSWQDWLPANWYAVGRCETGYGGDPNWNHANSSFVSAFGISRSIYDSDAAHAGQPPWNDTHPPTPRQQYLTALAHYNLYGDGGGCPGP